MVKKVVVLGPESTGKSTLCNMLAQKFNTQWCPEFAREYLLEQGTAYTYQDLLTIAKGQLALEEEYIEWVEKRGCGEDGKMASPEDGKSESALGLTDLPINQLLFLDTNQYVMKVWCEYVFNDCHNWILQRIAERNYELYLLCKPDLPWVKDELREYPDEKPRQELFHLYRDLLIHQSSPWVEISGNYAERFAIAQEAIKRVLS